ncbi:MAG: phosphatase PAP2 family protein [Chloroherpetonaceae bacterium]
MKLPLLFLFIAFTVEISAQPRNTVSHDASAAWQNAKAIYASPIHYSPSQWLTVAGVLSLTACSHAFDEPMRTFARAHQTPTLNALFSVGEFYGNPIGAGVIGGGLYLGGLSGRNASARLTGRAVLESVLYASLLTQVLKMSIGRSRPYQNKGARDFNGLSWTNRQWSFPSGHTTIAFATSASLSARLKNPFATVGLFGLALLTTGHRLYDDQHWLSDTVLGAAIGTSIGLAVGKLINDEERHGETLPPQATQSIFSVQLPL